MVHLLASLAGSLLLSIELVVLENVQRAKQRSLRGCAHGIVLEVSTGAGGLLGADGGKEGTDQVATEEGLGHELEEVDEGTLVTRPVGDINKGKHANHVRRTDCLGSLVGLTATGLASTGLRDDDGGGSGRGTGGAHRGGDDGDAGDGGEPGRAGAHHLGGGSDGGGHSAGGHGEGHFVYVTGCV